VLRLAVGEVEMGLTVGVAERREGDGVGALIPRAVD
jgi:hypothetical protein